MGLMQRETGIYGEQSEQTGTGPGRAECVYMKSAQSQITAAKTYTAKQKHTVCWR